MQTAQELTRRERKRKLTRETLVTVAMDIISKQGIYITTIEDVTEKADIGKGTFYQYFSSKEELLETLLRQGLDNLLTACESRIPAQSSMGNRVRSLVKSHVAFLIEEESFVLIFHQVRGLLQLKKGISANLREIYADYLLSLARLIENPVTPTAKPQLRSRELAVSLASYATGFINHYRLFHKKLNLSMRREDIEENICTAIL